MKRGRCVLRLLPALTLLCGCARATEPNRLAPAYIAQTLAGLALPQAVAQTDLSDIRLEAELLEIHTAEARAYRTLLRTVRTRATGRESIESRRLTYAIQGRGPQLILTPIAPCPAEFACVLPDTLRLMGSRARLRADAFGRREVEYESVAPGFTSLVP